MGHRIKIRAKLLLSSIYASQSSFGGIKIKLPYANSFTVPKYNLLCECSLIGIESWSSHDVTFIAYANAQKLTVLI